MTSTALPPTVDRSLPVSSKASSSMGSTRRRRAVLLAKLLGTGAACTWMVVYIDWSLFWDTVRVARYWLLALVVMMRFGGLLLSSYKWQQLLDIHGVQYRLGSLVRWYLVATFLNHFLPSSIGGDAFRVHRTLGNTRARSCAVVAVVMERVTGLLALLVMGLAAAILLYARSSVPAAAGVAIICAGGILAATAGALLDPRLASLRWLATRYAWARKLAIVPELLDDFHRSPRRTLLIAAVSFLFHANKIAAAWLLLFALGTTLSPVTLTVVIAGVEVVGLLPITLGGLGLVEASFVYLSGQFGVPAEPALAAVLLLRVLNLPLSAGGAYFYALGDRAPARVSPPPEEPRSTAAEIRTANP
jgi:glycosyltransferase 2 family protein